MRGASRPSSEQPLVELSVETVPGGAVASLPVRKHPIGRSTDVFAGERSRSRASPAATRVSDDLTEGAEISLALRVSPDAPLRERPSVPRLLAIGFSGKAREDSKFGHLWLSQVEYANQRHKVCFELDP